MDSAEEAGELAGAMDSVGFLFEQIVDELEFFFAGLNQSALWEGARAFFFKA